MGGVTKYYILFFIGVSFVGDLYPSTQGSLIAACLTGWQVAIIKLFVNTW